MLGVRGKCEKGLKTIQIKYLRDTFFPHSPFHLLHIPAWKPTFAGRSPEQEKKSCKTTVLCSAGDMLKIITDAKKS